MIHTITVGSPAEINGEEGRRVLAAFYSELLGMRIIREDWLKIARGPETVPQLALDGDGWEDQRPPRWQDPEFPQQMHFDIFVRDLETAHALVMSRGARLLERQDGFRTYADPAGHPFCLYPDDRADDEGGVIGRIVLDCLSPRSLAVFYEGLLNMTTRVEDTPHRVVIAGPDGGLPMLGFQHAVFRAARWPDPAYPAQLHMDLIFDERRMLDIAERLGAVRLPEMGASSPTNVVLADPAGHPFCMGLPGE